MRLRKGALVLLLSMCNPLPIFTQDRAAVRLQPSKDPPTLPILYRSFLAYQFHLEQKADALHLQGKDGEDFRTHYQKAIGLSGPEFAIIRASAVHLHGVLATKDLQIHDLIESSRAVVPKGPLPKGYLVPPPPPQLKLLFDDRAALVNTEIETLRKQLTSADVAKLEEFLQKDYAPAVTLGTLPKHVVTPHRTLVEAK